MVFRFFALLLALILGGCGADRMNSPYPNGDNGEKVLYRTFSDRPNHLDPSQSYSANEWAVIAQIYEPPLEYSYLERPYRLQPLSAAGMPIISHLNAAGEEIDPNGDEPVVATRYTIRIRSGMRYQPHPAFTTSPPEGWSDSRWPSPAQFPEQGTREVVAADFVHQIKRLANPRLHSPIYGLMAEHIVGLAGLHDQLQQVIDTDPERVPDLRDYRIAGVEVTGRYEFQITVKNRYPQFIYWLAMPFFAPVPPEADLFYATPGFTDRNMTLDWFPLGSGPYMMTENNPNRRMRLVRNPNYHNTPLPNELGGGPMPRIDRIEFVLEKESIPAWTKFVQGYYDLSGVPSDSFDQAIQVGDGGGLSLTDELEAKGIGIDISTEPTIFYLGFNMLDPLLGGSGERARKLRQAIAIAVDWEEYIAIFQNGRGLAAQGPLPPGIFGYRPEDVNPVTHRRTADGVARRSVDEARALLAAARYPNGIDADTGQPLILHFDFLSGGPGEKARLDWFRKQFQKIDLQLEVRATTYNRFQEKMRVGNAQIFLWGWHADYPDPENFLFLLYGPNGKVQSGGENTANYTNPEFDGLYERMRLLENGPEREAVLNRMIELVRQDSPWLWGFYPTQVTLFHSWVRDFHSNSLANNDFKYLDLDLELRRELRHSMNRPKILPMVVLLVVAVLLWLPAWRTSRRRKRASAYEG